MHKHEDMAHVTGVAYHGFHGKKIQDKGSRCLTFTVGGNPRP